MQNDLTHTKLNLPPKVRNIAYALIAIGLFLGAIGLMLDFTHAIYNYLLTFVFILSLSLGVMFLIALEYVVGADWSVPFRRINEFFASVLPYLLILVIPLFLSLHSLFHWTHTETVQSDKILQGKTPYLNETFFLIRNIIFIIVWSLFFYLMTKNSRRQDLDADQKHTRNNIKLAAGFIPVFAITVTLASIDWLMSLEPHWFSTIFGIYFFAGSVVASFSAVTLAGAFLWEHRLLNPKINEEHFHNFGSLLFTFINFWGYIAFSQYMLIWYANMPEETFWLINRWQGGWIWGSLLLIFVHFVVPYFMLLSQPSKMNIKKLKFVSIWLLIAHFIDLYWLIMPQMKTDKTGILYFFIDIAFPIAAVGFIVLIFYFNSKKHNILPVGDPKLKRGLNFKL